MIKQNAFFYENLVKQTRSFLEIDPEILITFDYGARVEIKGNSEKLFRVEFWEKEMLVYSTELRTGHYATPHKKYFVEWKIRVYDGNRLLKEHDVSLENKVVYVFLDSSSLGDSLAWMPQIERFREVVKCKLILTTFHNDLFVENYPQIIWNDPGTVLPQYDYRYTIGYHIGEDRHEKIPVDPRTIPLGQIPCEILGIPYEEKRPLIKTSTTVKNSSVKKYVCIATMSTAGAKLWQLENGWQQIVDYLNNKGYDVVVIQKEETSLKNVVDKTGNFPLSERIEVLKHCEFFIGLGSGLSWLAWAMKKPVILISGFSDVFAEFQLDCERVINKNVCNSCWNDVSVAFDKGDWNWCPRHKNTERQFECTKQISVKQVSDHIDKLSI